MKGANCIFYLSNVKSFLSENPGCEQLKGEDLKVLKKLTSLESLDLSWCTELKDKDLIGLEKLTQLKSAGLSSMEITQW